MIDENLLLSPEDGNILFHYNLNENIFKIQNLIISPKFLFFKSLCCKLLFPMGHSTLRILQAIFIAKTSKYTESSEEAGLVALPGPPGSMSEPSCSRTVRKQPS